MTFELGDEPLEAAAGWSAAHGVATVVLNPAPARPVADALLGAAPLLTPNAGELAQLSGAPDGDLRAAATASAPAPARP